MNIIGTNLKDLRLKKNITLDKLADEINERFNISITRSMISKWETGKFWCLEEIRILIDRSLN